MSSPTDSTDSSEQELSAATRERIWCRLHVHWWKTARDITIGANQYVCRSCGARGEIPWT